MCCAWIQSSNKVWSTCVPVDDSGMSHDANMLGALLGSPDTIKLTRSPPWPGRDTGPVFGETVR